MGRKPLHEVDEVHLYGAVELSCEARDLLLAQGIDTYFLTATGQYRGRLVGLESLNAARRLAQYRRLGEVAGALALAKAVVVAKLNNQRALVVRWQRERAHPHHQTAAIALAALSQRALAADDLEILRGFEGQGAALYFRALGAAIMNPELPFGGRNRRPPRDPVNAGLSFAYTLLLTRVDAAVRRAGLDISLGALHEPGRGRPCLALDLMEPFRPAIDRLILRLVNRRQWSPADFREPPPGTAGRIEVDDPLGEPLEIEEAEPPKAVYLGPTGRSVLLREFTELGRTRVDHEGLSLTLAQVVEEQARAVARWVEDRSEVIPLFQMPPRGEMYLLVCYDVVKDARRNRVYKYLLGQLRPVQKSVFEGPLPDHKLGDLEAKLGQLIDRQTDSVRIYRLCRSCQAVVSLIGTSVDVPAEAEDLII